MPFVVLDGANIAYEERTAGRKPKLQNIQNVRKELEKEGFDVIVIVDASLVYEIDDKEQLRALIEKGQIKQVPAATDADYFVLRTAEEFDAVVMSNDLFKPWREQFPWVEERRVPVMIIEGTVEIYEPKLEEAVQPDTANAAATA